MSKKSSKTFRLAFIRRRINTTFRSRELRASLLAELEWMDRMEDEENEESDDDSDDDFVTEDEGYNTSPEVDFDQYDYWALGLNSFLWRIDLYKEGQDGFWTL